MKLKNAHVLRSSSQAVKKTSHQSDNGLSHCVPQLIKTANRKSNAKLKRMRHRRLRSSTVAVVEAATTTTSIGPNNYKLPILTKVELVNSSSNLVNVGGVAGLTVLATPPPSETSETPAANLANLANLAPSSANKPSSSQQQDVNTAIADVKSGENKEDEESANLNEVNYDDEHNDGDLDLEHGPPEHRRLDSTRHVTLFNDYLLISSKTKFKYLLYSLFEQVKLENKQNYIIVDGNFRSDF